MCKVVCLCILYLGVSSTEFGRAGFLRNAHRFGSHMCLCIIKSCFSAPGAELQLSLKYTELFEIFPPIVNFTTIPFHPNGKDIANGVFLLSKLIRNIDR